MQYVESEGSDLVIPRELAETLVAERLFSTMRADPLVFHQGNQLAGGIHLGNQPAPANLLEAIQGWAAIGAGVVADRVMGLDDHLEVVAARRGPDGKEDVETLVDHPAMRLLHDPGPVFSIDLLLALTTYHVLQTGTAYWQKIRDGIGMPVQLWPLPPQNTVPLGGKGADVITGYRVTSGTGQQTDLPREDVIRIWKPDPLTLYTSIGRLGPQHLEFDAQRYLAEHLKRHFEHDATPRVVIQARDAKARPPKGDVAEAFEATWLNAYARRTGTKVGLPAFIPGAFEAKELDAHADKAGLTGLSEQYASQILAAYHVSPISVGRDTNVNRATAETSGWLQDRNAVLPLTKLIAGALTRQLILEDFRPEDRSMRVFVRFRQFVAPDKEFELARDAKWLETGRESVNEQRDRQGDDPAPWGDRPILPFSMQPYTGEVLTAEPLQESADDLEPEPDRAIAATPTRSEPVAREERQVALDALLWKRLLETEKRWTEKMAGVVSGIFDQQRREAVKLLTEADADGRQARSPVDPIFEGTRWERLFRARFEPLRRSALEESATQLLLDIGSEASFVFTDRVREILADQGSRMVTNVNATTRARLNRAIGEGIANGEPLAGLVKRVNGVMRNRTRARAIARTELLKANQAGQVESIAQAGLERQQWNTARDGDVRDSHQINGQQQPVGGSFELRSGALAAYPGDPALPAAEVVNCRCFVSPVID